MATRIVYFRVEINDPDVDRRERYLKDNVGQAVANTGAEAYTLGVYDADGQLTQQVLGGKGTAFAPEQLWDEDAA